MVARRIADECRKLVRLTSLSGTGLANKSFGQFAIKMNRLSLARDLGNVENKDGVAVVSQQVFPTADRATKLASLPQSANERPLHIVRVDHSFDGVRAFGVLYSKDNPATIGVCKC